MKNIYFSDEDPNSNFSGNWDEQCIYCGRPHFEHIWKDHPDPNYKQRMPCEAQKAFMRAESRQVVRTGKMMVLIVWILIPLAIAIAGFTNWWVGFAAFLISLGKIGWELIRMFAKPEKWLPGFKEKRDHEAKIRQFIYHCERNPQGFSRLVAENESRQSQ